MACTSGRCWRAVYVSPKSAWTSPIYCSKPATNGIRAIGCSIPETAAAACLRWDELQVNDGKLEFVDAAGKTDIDVSVNSLPVQGRDTAAPIGIAGKAVGAATPSPCVAALPRRWN